MQKANWRAILDFLKWLPTFFFRRKETVDKERLLGEVSVVESKMNQVQSQIDQAQNAVDALPGLREQKAEMRGVLNTLHGLLQILDKEEPKEKPDKSKATPASKKEKKDG